MIKRALSSKNLTRTCVTQPRDPVLPITFITIASFGYASIFQLKLLQQSVEKVRFVRMLTSCVYFLKGAIMLLTSPRGQETCKDDRVGVAIHYRPVHSSASAALNAFTGVCTDQS
eukprot:TRINITY_DN768_c0_g2_i2.p2 TRINITY_DN768_c0_g2~~TRINITY_DN768_c0_g2_i2.p2  ORF type:complete len:115 (-),score=4.99 TRINITY_DN768_c0_g2_i2:31-375(-)